MTRLAAVGLTALLVACNNTPHYTPGDGATTGVALTTGGTGSTGGTTGGTNAGTTGTVQGSAMLSGAPFTVASGYETVTPPDGGGVYSNVVVVMLADALTCGSAETLVGSNSFVSLSLSGPQLAVGTYSVGTSFAGQVASIEMGVAYPDAGEDVYNAGAGSSMSFLELDATAVQATFNASFALADAGTLQVEGTAINVPYCAGLQ